MNIWNTILEKLQENKKVILLLVVSHKGSSPGKQGFKMMVSEGGFLSGSIGGGRTEFELAEKAKYLLLEDIKEPFFQNQEHRDEAEDSSGMICSGEQLVLFYPLKYQHIDMVKRMVLENKGVLTITNKLFSLTTDAHLSNTDFNFEKVSSKKWTYTENINRKSYIYIVGGGHVGLAVAKLFKMLDFEVTMLDDRPNLNTFEANTFSDHKFVIDYENIYDYIKEGDHSYIIILTHGYQADRLIFEKLAVGNYKYIGLLGSKAKIRAMFRTMIADGCDKEKLAQADAPIGLPINSKTPEEIAVSIAAKVIAIRNGASNEIPIKTTR